MSSNNEESIGESSEVIAAASSGAAASASAAAVDGDNTTTTTRNVADNDEEAFVPFRALAATTTTAQPLAPSLVNGNSKPSPAKKKAVTSALPSVLTIPLPASSKLKTNKEGGVFVPGRAFGYSEKIRIAGIYLRLVKERANSATTAADGKSPRPVSNRDLMKAANISKGYSQKIIKEIKTTATLRDPNEHIPFRIRGAGNKSFKETDERFLLEMGSRQPRPSLNQIRLGLIEATGTSVAISTIHSFLKARLKQTDTATAGATTRTTTTRK